MSEALARQRCFNHAAREAAAKCLECGRFFCHECVTEHGGRVICAACLTRQTETVHKRQWSLLPVWRAAQCAVGFFVLWAMLYYLALTLIAIPSDFHEATFLDYSYTEWFQ